MWGQWLRGPSNFPYSQQQIWDWVATTHPSEAIAGQGITDLGASAAVRNFVGIDSVAGLYSGDNGIRQAVADQQWGLGNGGPVMAGIYAHSHAVMFSAASWHRLSDAMARPNLEWVKVQDPAQGWDVVISFGEWFNYDVRFSGNGCGAGECAVQIEAASQYGAGNAGMNQFEGEGGTYYGPGPSNPTGRWKDDGWGGCYWDENDSGPNQCSGSTPTGRYKLDGNGNCYWDPNDSGPDQCAPPAAEGTSVRNILKDVWSALKVLSPPVSFERANWSSRPRTSRAVAPLPLTQQHHDRQAITQKSATRNGTMIPHPFATDPNDILQNIVAAFRQTHLDEFTGESRFGARSDELRVHRVLDVTSLTNRPSYYVVELDDKEGEYIGKVAITKDGIILQVHSAAAGHPDRRSIRSEDARGVVARFTNATVRSMQFVYADNVAEPGNPVLTPLLRVGTDAGVLYLSSAGDAFAEEGSILDTQERDKKHDIPQLPTLKLKLHRLVPKM
jgi:hypothetical protein